MNYRDFNPANTCLPIEAYPYLWAATSIPGAPRPKLFGRLKALLWRFCAALPVVALTAAFLPLADPPPEHLIPLSEVAPDQSSAVWVQPKSDPQPQTMPRLVRISI